MSSFVRPEPSGSQPYRDASPENTRSWLLLEPLLGYIKQVADRRQPNEVITIVVPQFVPRKRWHELLHAQTGVLLRLALLFRPGIVITNVPYRVGIEGEVH